MAIFIQATAKEHRVISSTTLAAVMEMTGLGGGPSVSTGGPPVAAILLATYTAVLPQCQLQGLLPIHAEC